MVETAQVTGRRVLHFASYRDILDDVRALADAPTRQLGNWSLGQICVHLAKGMDMAVDGPSFWPPWYMRLRGRMLKKRILRGPMSPGFTLPRQAANLVPDPISDSNGLAVLEKSIDRIQQTSKPKPHVVYGSMTRDEWDQLQFRHAELHLSFIVPE